VTGCPSQWLDRHADHTPDRIALRCGRREVAYAPLARAVAIAAGALRQRGVRPGDRVAYLGPNAIEFVIALFACARLHAVLMPLNWRLAPAELAWIMQDSAPRVLLADAAFADLPIRAQGCAEHDLAALEDGAPVAAADVADGAPLLLVYTSGTTGRPKGAVLPRRTLLANALNATHMFGLSAQDHVLTVLPLFHVGGLNIQTVPALHAGAEVTLHERFDPARFLNDVALLRPTLSLLVPAVMRAIVDHAGWRSADLSSLRAVGAGSSDLPGELVAAFHARGVPVQNVYGATETGPVAVYQLVADAWRAPGALGRTALHTDVRLDAEGQVMVRGPAVLTGYWNGRPALDEAGWFATGDVARRDADGRLWFVDRLKHVIISGGENIYPAEIERVLRAVTGVAEVAVVGRADPRWGEVPVACVVGTASEQAVMEACAGALARFKQPRAVLHLPALPRTALGKVATAELRRLVAG
jgi:fatty-acyl-CoA synthase